VGVGDVHVNMLFKVSQPKQGVTYRVLTWLVTFSQLELPSNLGFCERCIEGKMHRKPFSSMGVHSLRKLQLVHSDVCTPMPVDSLGGHKYFVTFVDDYLHCCMFYFLKQKSEVFAKFTEFEAITANDFEYKIGRLRTDNGGEYISSECEEYLKSKRISNSTLHIRAKWGGQKA